MSAIVQILLAEKPAGKLSVTTVNKSVLSEELTSVLDKQSIHLSGFYKAFDNKIKRFSENLTEITDFIVLLSKAMTQRSSRLAKVIDEYKVYNEAVYDYVLKNLESINAAAGVPPQELLSFSNDQDFNDKLLIAWYKKDFFQEELSKIYKHATGKIKQELDKEINKLPADVIFHDKYFSFMEKDMIWFFQKYNTDFFEITPQEFINFKKTVHYLANQKDKLTTLNLAYLYMQSNFKYEYNDKLDAPSRVFKKKAGECIDLVYFLDALVKTNTIYNAQQNLPEVFYVKYGERMTKHAIGVFKLKDVYHYYDNGRVYANKDFVEGLKIFLKAEKYPGLTLSVQREDATAIYNREEPKRRTKDFIDINKSRKLAP